MTLVAQLLLEARLIHISGHACPCPCLCRYPWHPCPSLSPLIDQIDPLCPGCAPSCPAVGSCLYLDLGLALPPTPSEMLQSQEADQHQGPCCAPSSACPCRSLRHTRLAAFSAACNAHALLASGQERMEQCAAERSMLHSNPMSVAGHKISLACQGSKAHMAAMVMMKPRRHAQRLGT